MSATNRSNNVKHDQDYYKTPFSVLAPLFPYLPKDRVIWEPACGDRRLIQWLRDAGFNADGDDLCYGKDYLTDVRRQSFVLTNPPFSKAFDFCKHARRYSSETMFLLRLNFLGAQYRKEWWTKNEPSALFVLSERPDFTGSGGDACEYAWFYWGYRHHGIFHL